MKIAIWFKDNDYYYTFKNVLLILKDAENVIESKDLLVSIINELSLACYILHQNNSRDFSFIKKYLLIDSSNVFMGEEVDAIIKSAEWHNGQMFIWTDEHKFQIL